ncbi:MAG TPA: tetratricopeptide repeat protein, partial [Anaerolineae bacterium]|nr:tetratricopeptide repeat protein [Anaerolineae bacterium]
AYYQQAIEIHRQINDIDGLQTAYNNLGYLNLEQKNYSAAVENYIALAELAQVAGNALMASFAFVGLADAYLGNDAVQQALRSAANALEFSKKVETRIAQGISWRALGDVWLELGDAAQAKAYYEQSIPILEELNEEHDLVKAQRGLEIAASRLKS